MTNKHTSDFDLKVVSGGVTCEMRSTDPIAAAVTRALVDFAEHHPDGEFDFFEAEPVELSESQRAAMITQLIKEEPALTRAQAAAIIAESGLDRIVMSSMYQVALRTIPASKNDFGTDIVHLSIKRIDREPIHDWRALQTIKNKIVGEECEAIEIYPAESRLVDTANQYHLWALSDPQQRIPLGFINRLVSESSIGKSKQRPFESPDALQPSKQQLADSLSSLVAWMRDNTGPSDGVHNELVKAVELLRKMQR